MVHKRRTFSMVLLGSWLVTGVGYSADTVAPSKGGTATNQAAGTHLTHDEQVTQLLDYLEKDYTKKTSSAVWVTRAMGVISLARSPRPTASAKLLELCDKDKQIVVRLLAWQALLARTSEMDAKTEKHWMEATLKLAEQDAFHGALRVTLLDVLATAPMNPRSRQTWQKIFSETSAWEPLDIPVLNALARCLRTWKSGSLVESLITLYTDPNNGVRAEYVLHNAGCTAPIARDHIAPDILDETAKTRKHLSSTALWAKTQAEAAAWYQKDRANWKEGQPPTAPGSEPWKQLQPMYLAKPMPLSDVDPDDRFWTRDLELKPVDVRSFQAVFVVDATGSMGDVLAWLRRDVARVMMAFTMICNEPPSVGVVWYRDFDCSFVTRVMPMTTKLKDLEPGLMTMTADGGGDIPEAIREGLTAAVDGMAWGKGNRKGRMMILIGDAPPHYGTEAECEAMVKKGFDNSGIKTYTCKLTTVDGHNDLSEFDKIAAAGGGSSVTAEFGRIAGFRLLTPDGKDIPLPTVDRPEAQLIVAPNPTDQPPGEKILNNVLCDAINPQFKDRVLPLVQTLLAYCQAKSDAEIRQAFPADTPVLAVGKYDPQK